MRSASSSQRECVLTVANEVRLSTRRGKAEAKELPFVSTFLFSSGEEGGGGGYYLRSAYSYEQSEVERRLPLLRALRS